MLGSAGGVSREHIERRIRSTAGQSGISGFDLKKMPILVAPLAEQQRIVNLLDENLTKIDAAIANLKRVEANLKRYRASVLKAAVEGRLVPTEAELARQEGRDYEPALVLLAGILAERRRRWEEAELAKMKAAGKTPKDDKWKAKYEEPAAPDTDGLPELPEGWCWATVDALVREPLRNGHSSPEDKSGNGVPTLTLTAVTTGNFESNIKPTTADPEKIGNLWIEVGDIFVQRSNAPDLVGTSCMYRGVPGLAIFPDLLIRIRVTQQVLGDYVEAVLKSARVRNFFRTKSKGIAGSMPKISQDVISNATIPLPPMREQVRIVETLAALESQTASLTTSVHSNLVRCTRLRQSTLKWAFEGKLVDQDPNDEPASVLVERIRAERQAAAAKPSKKPTQKRSKKTPKK
jgi:type I restriction enzyme S subunit